MKKWALITGASQGIGAEFARLFAAEGWDIILVARDEAALRAVASGISQSLRRDVAIKLIPKDLTRAESALEIFSQLRIDNILVSALVNNAGFGAQGTFTDVDSAIHLSLVRLNVERLMELTRLFVPPMLKAGDGYVLNVASVVAFMPGPGLATYYASKAFVYSFTCALAKELDGTGVSATVLCPGLTTSQFHQRAGLHRKSPAITMSAADVAQLGYRAMLRRKPVIIPGWHNRLAVTLIKFLPMRVSRALTARMNR